MSTPAHAQTDAADPEAAPYRACRASAEISPRVSFVGQQLRYVARIVRSADVKRVEWILPPGFPDFRAERLPGHSEDTEMTYRGVTYWAREEHRAIHPLRAGVFTIPSARLRCTVEMKGQSQPIFEEVETGPLEVEVRPLPAAGRPPRFTGLVGRARLQVVVEPRTVTLGETVSLSVGVLGAANVWVLSELGSIVPLDSLGDAVDVFDQPSSLDLSASDGLVGRRFLRAELVPRREGTLVVPGARLAIFDPQLARYQLHDTEQIAVEVTARAGQAAAPERASEWASEWERTALDELDEPVDETAWLPIAVLGLGALALLPVLRALRRWQAWRPVREALAEADGAVMRADPGDEAAALERALRRAIALRVPDLAHADPDRLAAAARSPDHAPDAAALRRAADQLEALAAVRFSGEAAPCDRSAVDAVLEDLRSPPTRADPAA